jgi:hypothetical protein
MVTGTRSSRKARHGFNGEDLPVGIGKASRNPRKPRPELRNRPLRHISPQRLRQITLKRTASGSKSFQCISTTTLSCCVGQQAGPYGMGLPATGQVHRPPVLADLGSQNWPSDDAWQAKLGNRFRRFPHLQPSSDHQQS